MDIVSKQAVGGARYPLGWSRGTHVKARCNDTAGACREALSHEEYVYQSECHMRDTAGSDDRTTT
jgi:hypothetical protein